MHSGEQKISDRLRVSIPKNTGQELRGWISSDRVLNLWEESNATPLSKEAAADGKKTRSLPSVNWREMELWPRSGFGEKRVKFWPRCEGEREGCIIY